MTRTTTSFDEFLDGSGPDDAGERLALYEAVTYEDDRGLYEGVRASNGALLVKASHGDMTLVLATPAAVKGFIARLCKDLSEEGASFEGDADFERAMAKDD